MKVALRLRIMCIHKSNVPTTQTTAELLLLDLWLRHAHFTAHTHTEYRAGDSKLY